jgi:peptidyl-prolyl cis-trans isomerase B (cyclophilin B)
MDSSVPAEEQAEPVAEEAQAEEAQPVAMTTSEETQPNEAPEPGKERQVRIKTSMGDIIVKLYNETPVHRDNFIKLAENGSLKGSNFHRVIKGFMIQGGSAPGSNGSNDVGEQLPAEIKAGLYHKKGALAAARMGDQVNPQRKSSGSQFYIVHGKIETEAMLARYGQTYTPEQIETYGTIGGVPFLDNQYTVFGEVIKGLEIVDKIANVQTRPGDVPVTEVSMELEVVK